MAVIGMAKPIARYSSPNHISERTMAYLTHPMAPPMFTQSRVNISID